MNVQQFIEMYQDEPTAQPSITDVMEALGLECEYRALLDGTPVAVVDIFQLLLEDGLYLRISIPDVPLCFFRGSESVNMEGSTAHYKQMKRRNLAYAFSEGYKANQQWNDNTPRIFVTSYIEDTETAGYRVKAIYSRDGETQFFMERIPDTVYEVVLANTLADIRFQIMGLTEQGYKVFSSQMVLVESGLMYFFVIMVKELP